MSLAADGDCPGGRVVMPMMEEKIIITLIRTLPELLEAYFIWVIILILVAIVCDALSKNP